MVRADDKLGARRLRVGLIVPSFGDEDAVSTPVVRTLLNGLSQEVDLRVLALRYPPRRAPFPAGAAMVHAPVPDAARLRTLLRHALAELRAMHRQAPFDVLHALWLHEPGSVALLARAAGVRVPVLASIGGAEVVALPEIGYGGQLARLGRVVNGSVLARAGLVSCGSRYVLDLARRVRPRRSAEDFRLAPLPVDTDVFTPGGPLLPDRTASRLLHAASLIPVKDQTTLLRAFARIVEQLPGACLDIAGEDPHGQRAGLERLCGELGLAGRVRWLGPVEHVRMADLYRRADVFLLTSQHESQGMVVLEAAAAGVPTVGTAVGVVPDLAPGAAVAVPPADPEALAAATVELLRTPERLRAMGAAARVRAEAEYAIRPATDRFVTLYADLLAARRR